jgi:hypothetical protein
MLSLYKSLDWLMVSDLRETKSGMDFWKSETDFLLVFLLGKSLSEFWVIGLLFGYVWRRLSWSSN